MLCPAISLNEGEIVGINVGPKFEHRVPAIENTNGEGAGDDADRAGIEFKGVCEWIDWGSIGKDREEKEAPGAAKENIASAQGGLKAILSVAKPVALPPLPPQRKETLPLSVGGGQLIEKAGRVSGGVKVSVASAAFEPPGRKDEGAAAAKPSPEFNVDEFDLEAYSSVKELEALGMDNLKAVLLEMGCKGGGSLQERVGRLFFLRGLKREEYPRKVRGKNFRV